MFLLLILSGVNESKVQAEAGVFPITTDVAGIETKMAEYIEAHQDTTAGLAYSVFCGNEDLVTGYYGYADIENHLAVDDETVFEWGSASKIMVWVSVMQLAEQGRLDLDADIREYLPKDFLSNARYDTAITMVNLMNHSAGFQEDYVDLFVKDCTDFTCLEDALAAHKPEQIFEPGALTAYSNWSTALAAFVVERVSGMSYVEYVHQHIFEPLGMEHIAIAMDLSDNDWVAAKRKEPGSFFSHLLITIVEQMSLAIITVSG
ncbi:MAG: serine hydrolase domain-containing protein [Acetatifactor sp.]